MKIVLSRKGFDADYGKCASPILPDGSLVSLPIPVNPKKGVGNQYSEIATGLRDYPMTSDLVNQLGKPLDKEWVGHLDPDLRFDCLLHTSHFSDASEGSGEMGHPLWRQKR